jgi:hypothetical protein
MAHNFKKGDRVLTPDGRRGYVTVIFPNSTIVEILLDESKYVYPLRADVMLLERDTSLDRITDGRIMQEPISESVADATGISDFDPQAYADWATEQFLDLPASVKADGCDPIPEEYKCGTMQIAAQVDFEMRVKDGPEVDILRASKNGFYTPAIAKFVLESIKLCRRNGLG